MTNEALARDPGDMADFEVMDPAKFNRLAGLLTGAKKRVDRAVQRLRLARQEQQDAENAQRRAQETLDEYVRNAVIATDQPDFFQPIEWDKAWAASHRTAPGVAAGISAQGPLATASEEVAAEDIPLVPIAVPVIEGEGPVPDFFHCGRCGEGDFEGCCKYGDDETCPVMRLADPVRKEEEVKPIRCLRAEDGTVTIEVQERTVSRGARLSATVLPAGTIEGLPDAPRYWVWRELAADAWAASPSEDDAAGQMRINIGTVDFDGFVADAQS